VATHFSLNTPESTPSGQYQALLDVAKSILAHQDLAALFRDLSKLLSRLLHFDFLSLVLYDAALDAMRLQILETIGPPQERPFEYVPVADSPAGWVWQNQQPLIIDDTAVEKRWPRVMPVLRENSIRAIRYFPLTTAQRRLGAVGFGFQELREVTKDEIRFLENIAAQVAVAVDNALSHKELEHERDRLRVLLDVTNALVSNREEHALFRSISACLGQVAPHEYASLAILRPETQELVIKALEFPSGTGLIRPDMVIPLRYSPAGVALERRQAVRYDHEAIAALPAAQVHPLISEGIRTIVSLPLITRHRALGTLNVGSVRDHAFSDADVLFLTQVANQIAIAVENALSFREISQLKDKLAEEKLYLEDEIRTERNFGEMVGESTAFRHILKQVETVGPTGANVLITGETGTGKELIARAIHEWSGRRERTFVKLNCAAIPTGLLESELFGHEKGAFTGAIAQKVGRLELAHNGTLFLDEVGNIPLELQPKLLRTLQEREFERLGATRTIHVDARLIAATNRDLAQMIAEREFRSDLYYRLNVFPIEVPPLRERQDDIPILVRYFARKYARRMNRRIETIPAEAMSLLIAYHWPGNIRELESLIERAVILSPSSTLRVPELSSGAEADTGPKLTLEAAERAHILRALKETNGVLAGPKGAAARLGMKRTTLQSRMKKLGIRRTG
jgi:formate hydrogenlyase transcriptional activator